MAQIMLQKAANLIPQLPGELQTNAKTLKRFHGDVKQESLCVSPSSSVRLHDLLVSLNKVVIKIDSYTNACLDLATFGDDSDLSSSIKESLEKGSSIELVEFLEVLQSHTKTIIEHLDDILKGVIETETLMPQSMTIGDVNTGQPVRVGSIAKVGVGIAVAGAIYGCFVVSSPGLIAGSVMIGVLAFCQDAGRGHENTLHRLMESLNKELNSLRQEVDRCKTVGKNLQEKLGNCIYVLNDGEFDSGASLGVSNFAEACNKLNRTRLICM